jgi:hypothetical protein
MNRLVKATSLCQSMIGFRDVEELLFEEVESKRPLPAAGDAGGAFGLSICRSIR